MRDPEQLKPGPFDTALKAIVNQNSKHSHGSVSRLRSQTRILNDTPRETESAADNSILYEQAPALVSTTTSALSHAISNMSQRNRQPRDRARNTGHDNGEETALWNDIQDKVNTLAKIEAKSKDINQQIFDMEDIFKTREKNDGISEELQACRIRALTSVEPSPAEIQTLDLLYRANLKQTEESKVILNEEDLVGKLSILKGLVSHNEQEAAATRNSNPRDSHPRSAMDFDGSTDSPGPSPAENKHVRKLGVGRLSSQPPRDKEKDTSEPSEPSSNVGRTKITFAIGQEVAFKPKIQNQTEEHDWIQGIVVKVIGEGKSRRYDVQDPFPDDPSRPGVVYRSSASSMVPIPPNGSPLGPYEVGKQVLALYPETTTFYRAEVKSMLENGSKVQLLFEDEAQGALRVVDRRFVLDHKG